MGQQLASLFESASPVSVVAHAVRDIVRDCAIYVCNDCHTFCDCGCFRCGFDTNASGPGDSSDDECVNCVHGTVESKYKLSTKRHA